MNETNAVLEGYIVWILEWASAKGIIGKDNVDTRLNTQQLKFMSELGEYCDSVIKNDREQIADALGDMFVVSCSILYLDMAKRGFFNDLPFKSECGLCKRQFGLKPNVTSISEPNMHTFEYLTAYVNECDVKCIWLSLEALARYHRLDFVQCVSGAYNTIKDRTGKTLPNGNFVKD